MGFLDSLLEGISSLASSAEETMAKKFCDGDPIRNAPRKVEELIRLIKNSYNSYYDEHEDEDIHKQRVNQLRVIMNYLKKCAVADTKADDVRKRIISRYGSDLHKLGINV